MFWNGLLDVSISLVLTFTVSLYWILAFYDLDKDEEPESMDYLTIFTLLFSAVVTILCIARICTKLGFEKSLYKYLPLVIAILLFQYFVHFGHGFPKKRNRF